MVNPDMDSYTITPDQNVPKNAKKQRPTEN